MRERLLLTAAAPALALIYWLAVAYALGVAAAYWIPAMLWLGLVPKHGPTPQWHLLATELSLQTIAIVVVSAPFAWVVGRFYKRLATVVAAAMALLAVVGTYAPFQFEVFETGESFFRARWLVEAIETCFILPILVWIVQRLPASYRLERPGARKNPITM